MTDSEQSIRLWQTATDAKLPPEPLVCVSDGSIAHVVINRPSKRNALTARIWHEIPDILAQLAETPAVKLIVLRGAGTAAFSGGADIDEFPTAYRDTHSTRRYNTSVQRAQLALERLCKPTIALIFGACVGGGAGLALCCDLRFAAEDARFGITPSKLGTVYSAADTRRLVSLVGPSRAKDILFSGRLLSAVEAAEWGLVDRIAAPAELERLAAQYVRSLLSNSHRSLVSAKVIVNSVAGIDVRPEQDLEHLFEESFASRDFVEGFAAFREKRSPRFD
jgi:enoyl-CoA hydratase/carnithine racemase